MQQENLFEQPGLHTELLQIRDWLDKGSPNEMRILLNELFRLFNLL